MDKKNVKFIGCSVAAIANYGYLDFAIYPICVYERDIISESLSKCRLQDAYEETKDFISRNIENFWWHKDAPFQIGINKKYMDSVTISEFKERDLRFYSLKMKDVAPIYGKSYPDSGLRFPNMVLSRELFLDYLKVASAQNNNRFPSFIEELKNKGIDIPKEYSSFVNRANGDSILKVDVSELNLEELKNILD